MSRNFIPAVLAVGMGIFTGYYTFQPALQDLRSDQDTSQGEPKKGQQPTNTEKKNTPVSSPSAPVNDPNSPGK